MKPETTAEAVDLLAELLDELAEQVSAAVEDRIEALTVKIFLAGAGACLWLAGRLPTWL